MFDFFYKYKNSNKIKFSLWKFIFGIVKKIYNVGPLTEKASYELISEGIPRGIPKDIPKRMPEVISRGISEEISEKVSE